MKNLVYGLEVAAMIISKLVKFIKNIFKKKDKRENFLIPGSAEKRNAMIRQLKAEKVCATCNKTEKEAKLEYDPVRQKYYCKECWKEDVK